MSHRSKLPDFIKKQRRNYWVRKSKWKARGVKDIERAVELYENRTVCEICKKDTDDLYLDHCHTTGLSRGILCRPCNMALGHFKDDINLMKESILYLERNGNQVYN